MSSYRDDVNETLWLADAFVSKLRSQAESTLRMSDEPLFGLSERVVDAPVVLGDQVQDRVRIARAEAVALGDVVLDQATMRNVIAEGVRLGDAIFLKAKALQVESFSLADQAMATVGAAVREPVLFGDQVLGRRVVRQLVEDGFVLGDAHRRLAREMVVEAVVLGDFAQGRLRARDLLVEALALVATVNASTTTDGVVVERFRLYDEAIGSLRARDVVADGLVLWDEVLQTGDYGQAWTCGMDSWAMSRFAPLTFDSLAVIDGTVYGCNVQGVFAFDGDAETMTAELRTGALDMTGGVLGHPLEAHVEYELRGTAQFGVTTTQSGTPVIYTYPLNARPVADALTNARSEFGRGLRGRHFSYTLRLTGQRAYINDWSVLIAPSKRSL